MIIILKNEIDGDVGTKLNGTLLLFPSGSDAMEGRKLYENTI